MKNYIVFIAFVAVFASCHKPKSKEPISFDKIDLIITDQWERIYKFNMDSLGNTKVSIGGKFAKAMKKDFLMNELVLDSISKVAKKIDIAKIDTGYNDTCKICVGYKIQLSRGGKNISTHVKSIHTNPKIADLDNLADLLYNVVRTADNKLDNIAREK